MSFTKVMIVAWAVLAIGASGATSAHYVEADPIGLAGGVNTYAYVSDRPIASVDPSGLTPLPYAQIADIVAENNHSGLSNELIICLLWNESNFDPMAGGGRLNRGNGLAGVTRIATAQVNNNFGYNVYLPESWSDPSWSVDVGTRYLNWVLTRRAKGSVAEALRKYGTGNTYPAPQIIECEKCLKDQQAQSNTQCMDPNACLRKVHN
jgi:hypothetical protein